MPATDIITDTIDRLQARQDIPAEVRAEVETELRADWGGERVYVAKQGEDASERLSRRDAQIRREYRRGERVPLLARRHGISVRRVQQILQCSGDIATPTTEKE